MRYALALGVLAICWPAALYIHQRHVSVSHTSLTLCNTNATGDMNLSLPDCSSLSTTVVAGPRSQFVNTYARQVFVDVEHPAWEDPVALAIVLGGAALAVGIARAGRRRDQPERTKAAPAG